MTNQKHLRPALLGGPKAVSSIDQEANRWPILTQEDEQAVLQVMRDGDISLHQVTRDLEEDYCQHFGVSHALAHCNGTAALLAAFFALDLHPGDEVIVPSATFWASVVPMLWVGALPVFCESEPDRLGLDPEDVVRKITPRTRAIVVVHLWGMPSKMTELLDIARRFDLKIIEDASHAQGAIWRGRKCGTLGDISVFSLQGSKLAPAGEGGILLTNSEEYFEKSVCLGDIVRVMELPSPARRFAGTSFGIKTRMAPISAAIARVQLRHLNERNNRRNENLRYLSDQLQRLGFEAFLSPAHIDRVYFEFLIRYHAPNAAFTIQQLLKALVAEGCEAQCPRYPLVHQQPLFTEGHFAKIARLEGNSHVKIPTYTHHALPLTEKVNGELIKLPSFPSADRMLLDQYVEAFEKVLFFSDEIVAHLARAEDDRSGAN